MHLPSPDEVVEAMDGRLCDVAPGRSFPRRIVVADGPGTCLTNESEDGGMDLAYARRLVTGRNT